MKTLRTAAGFILKNFATPIAFFAVFQFAGPKPAIAVAVTLAFCQLLAQRWLGHKLSPFFLAASVFTLLFGSMDFFVHEPRYFRLEPAVENFALGLVFAGTIAAGKPIALWFAQSLPAQFRPELDEGDAGYLRGVTIAWMLYFLLKGLLLLYLAFEVDLGMLILLRSIIGGVSMVLMFGGEYVYRTRIRKKAAGPAILLRR